MMHDSLGYSNGNDAWSYIVMFVMMALVVVGIFVFIRYFGQNSSSTQNTETALDILKKRYAKGEIDKKEFAEKRKELTD